MLTHSTLDTAPSFRHNRGMGRFLCHLYRIPAWLLVVLVLGIAAPWFAGVNSANAQQKATQVQRAWLGIAMMEKPDGVVLIESVIPGSPADKAGLRAGDTILRVAGIPMHTARDTARTVGDHRVGSVVQIAIARGGIEQTVSATLEPYPTQDQMLRMSFVGRPAPALRGLLTPDGAPGPTLDSFRGKVVVLDFWGTFCGACRLTTRSLNAWHERYAGRGLEVHGVAAEAPDAVSRGAQRFGMQHSTSADPDATTSSAYHARDLPTLILIDRKGIVRDVATGYSPAQLRQMEATIVRLLTEPVPKP